MTSPGRIGAASRRASGDSGFSRLDYSDGEWPGAGPAQPHFYASEALEDVWWEGRVVRASMIERAKVTRSSKERKLAFWR
jgi:hypothetical protein